MVPTEPVGAFQKPFAYSDSCRAAGLVTDTMLLALVRARSAATRSALPAR